MSTFTTEVASAITAEAPTTLVLSRKLHEAIMIGDEVEIRIVDIGTDRVRLSITAPRSVPVHRKEVYEAIKRKNRAAGMQAEERSVQSA